MPAWSLSTSAPGATRPTTRTCSSPPACCTTWDWTLATRQRAGSEVEGADLAASLLADHGVPASDIDRVWEAIALHSSHGIADRRGLLAYLTYKGVFTDAGRFTDIPAAELSPVRAITRPPGDTSVRDAIVVRHALRSEAAAPLTRSRPS